MTDEELILLNCVMYDPKLGDHQGQTLRQWAQAWLQAPPLTGTVGGMTGDQMNQVARSVLADDTMSSYTIADVTSRHATGKNDSNANDATFTNKASQTAVVAFEGTSGQDEWEDDGEGGYISVSDTPDQKAALHYYTTTMAAGGAGYGYSNVITTGHSKGGNLAMYVAITSGGSVDRTLSLDGQGFGTAFLLKYQAAIAAQQSMITTYANAMDFVNLLFASVAGTTIFTQDPNLPLDQFANNHSPISVLAPDSDGILHVRPASDQDAKMKAADELTDYLQKFMSADDFALLCQMATGFAMNPPEVTIDDVFDTSKIMKALWELAVTGDVATALKVCVKEPYTTMVADLWNLLGNFYQGGGDDSTGQSCDRGTAQPTVPLNGPTTPHSPD